MPMPSSGSITWLRCFHCFSVRFSAGRGNSFFGLLVDIFGTLRLNTAFCVNKLTQTMSEVKTLAVVEAPYYRDAERSMQWGVDAWGKSSMTPEKVAQYAGLLVELAPQEERAAQMVVVRGFEHWRKYGVEELIDQYAVEVAKALGNERECFVVMPETRVEGSTNIIHYLGKGAVLRSNSTARKEPYRVGVRRYSRLKNLPDGLVSIQALTENGNWGVCDYVDFEVLAEMKGTEAGLVDKLRAFIDYFDQALYYQESGLVNTDMGPENLGVRNRDGHGVMFDVEAFLEIGVEVKTTTLSLRDSARPPEWSSRFRFSEMIPEKRVIARPEGMVYQLGVALKTVLREERKVLNELKLLVREMLHRAFWRTDLQSAREKLKNILRRHY